MMLSQPTTTGVFILAAAVAFAGGWMQRDAFDWFTASPGVQEADAARPVLPIVPEAERNAQAPARTVSGPGIDATETASTGPIVTVNGRPLGGSQNADDETGTAVADTTAEPPAEAEDATETVETAAVEPPRPMPRPEGLIVPQAADYEAITAAAYETAARPGPEEGFMSYEDRIALAPLAGGGQPMPRPAGQDELVAVVGPDGEVIWIYEDQAGGATGYEPRPAAKPGNPYGFVYDDYDFRW